MSVFYQKFDFSNPGENLNNLFLIIGFISFKIYFTLKFQISGLNEPTEKIKIFLKCMYAL